MDAGLHINLDDAWDPARLPMRTVDAVALGPHLRYTAPQWNLEKALAIFQEAIRGEDFILYGSGDFHHLAAWWLKAALLRHPGERKVTLVSFDNHPDWDVRPPRWACGGWINRALEFPQVQRAVVWGCGNFELGWPARLFRNRKALANGRLAIHAWAERQTAGVGRRFNCMTRENWRERFRVFAESLAGQSVYVTVDLDALSEDEAVTNWEGGLFSAQDIAWALGELRGRAEVFAGDCCGAFSVPRYARRVQRWIGKFDHPRGVSPPLEKGRRINHAALEIIWPALVGG